MKKIEVFRKENRFDFIFARDSANGLIRLAESDAATGVVNLGTGISRSISDVLSILQQHFPSMQIVEMDSQIPFEAYEADISLLYSYIGWKPEYTLEAGIGEVVEYEKKRNIKVLT